MYLKYGTFETFLKETIYYEMLTFDNLAELVIWLFCSP